MCTMKSTEKHAFRGMVRFILTTAVIAAVLVAVYFLFLTPGEVPPVT